MSKNVCFSLHCLFPLSSLLSVRFRLSLSHGGVFSQGPVVLCSIFFSRVREADSLSRGMRRLLVVDDCSWIQNVYWGVPKLLPLPVFSVGLDGFLRRNSCSFLLGEYEGLEAGCERPESQCRRRVRRREIYRSECRPSLRRSAVGCCPMFRPWLCLEPFLYLQSQCNNTNHNHEVK